MESSADKIYTDATLNKVIDDLLLNLFTRDVGNKKYIDVLNLDIRKAVWLASLLAKSNNILHKSKVQQLSSLLYLNNPEDTEIAKICYILYSRVGNLTATRFLTKLFVEYSLDPMEQVSNFSEDILLESELIRKRKSNMLEIDGRAYLTTDFQKNLWKNLVEEQNISVSAPTSSGKSFILKKYIEHQFAINEKYCVLYIVPSRALINQVSEELRVDLNAVEIKTAFIENEENIFSKIIYVLTPERAIKIVNLTGNIINPDIIFIDEIQGVEDEQGRGNLFEYVFGEFSSLFPNSKIITAGPNILNPNELFKELFNKVSQVSQTELSPVFQLKTIINLTQDSIEFTIYTDGKNTQFIRKLVDPSIKLMSLYDANRGKGLSIIINQIVTRPDENNIVFTSKGNLAETWAVRYSETLLEIKINQEIKDLIEYLKEDIHPKYILIRCLEKGVAFHHSKLSELARKEIEMLFQKGFIKTLFCTSTLLEGVNMPANNLFILKPEKNNLPLTNFEFGNLIGRAGRIKDSLYGKIFCITVNKENWAEDYYESTYSKEVITSSSKSLKKLNLRDIQKSTHDIQDPSVRNLLITLRHKYMKGEVELESFLLKKGLLKSEISSIETEIKTIINKITIPYNIVKLNPTIDPILQNELYTRIKEDGLTKWVININANFLKPYRRELAESIAYEENGFYWQLDSLIRRFNEIFKITRDLYFNDRLSINESTICQNTVSWIEGRSIGELIRRRINYLATDERIPVDKRIDPNSDRAINAVIREVININSKAVTYSLLKYVKLLADILDNIFNEEQKEAYKFTLSLPTFLELGSKEPTVIKLITSGMPRSIALRVFDRFKDTDDHKESKMDVFKWLSNVEFVEGLKPIYNKYLLRQKYLKINRG